MGTAAASMLGTFLVAASVDSGVSESSAGLLLALGSGFGVGGRVLFGWRAGLSNGRQLLLVRRLMVSGAVGFAVLAAARSTALLVLGTILAFGTGWGWNGVLVYGVVRTNPNRPAYATGVTQAGLYVGGMSGPVLFGVISDRWSFALGWWTGAVLLVLAWVAVLLGQRLITAGAAA